MRSLHAGARGALRRCGSGVGVIDERPILRSRGVVECERRGWGVDGSRSARERGGEARCSTGGADGAWAASGRW